ncbi:uncharacterized protein CEXT_1261 [Caerostris extrusa]|uniref:Sperm microtubule inner protein 1 C-terminal domain-containing protein n=1 Tax=Caerostris extrusa TaxID=172846 RepID=A0AAV4UU84_CAEEX|nr:uncharacterized protein CEXT_1261 [Caerostris extrusa]
MKPVPLDLKKHIYKGIGHDDKGKTKYLNIRYCTPPEERWSYPITSSMQIGWTFGFPQEMKAPEFGRKMTVYRSFFRTNDTQLKPRDSEEI